VDDVIGRITEAEKNAHAPAPPAWADVPLSAIIRHIVERHHAYIRTEGVRINGLFEKVVARHGQTHAEVAEIRDLFFAAKQELTTHMLKEEQILFPHIVRMEEAVNARQPLPAAFFGSVSAPITRLVADHDDAGALFARVNQLAGGYVPPEGACFTFRALYSALAEFERDLHEHVHIENNALFPRAMAIERGN
jgi:regulator of cell morphogenesis and NO signaling